MRVLVRRLRVDDIFRLHSFQKQAQGAPGKDIGPAGDRRIGGNFSNFFQKAFLLFGHLRLRARARYQNVVEFLPELEKLTEVSRGVGEVQLLSRIFMITASAS